MGIRDRISEIGRQVSFLVILIQRPEPAWRLLRMKLARPKDFFLYFLFPFFFVLATLGAIRFFADEGIAEGAGYSVIFCFMWTLCIAACMGVISVCSYIRHFRLPWQKNLPAVTYIILPSIIADGLYYALWDFGPLLVELIRIPVFVAAAAIGGYLFYYCCTEYFAVPKEKFKWFFIGAGIGLVLCCHFALHIESGLIDYLLYVL